VALPGVTEREALEAALADLTRRRDSGRPVRGGAGAEAPGGDRLRRPGTKAAAPATVTTPAEAEVATVVPFSAESRTSGVILADGTVVLKGAVDAIVAALDVEAPPELQTLSDEISSLGATPWRSAGTVGRWASSSSRTLSSPA